MKKIIKFFKGFYFLPTFVFVMTLLFLLFWLFVGAKWLAGKVCESAQSYASRTKSIEMLKPQISGYGYRTPTINGENNAEYQYLSVAGGHYIIKKTNEAEHAFAAEVWNEATLASLFVQEC